MRTAPQRQINGVLAKGGQETVDLSAYALEALRKDQDFVLYRGRSNEANAPSVLLLTTRSALATPETFKKIEHEY